VASRAHSTAPPRNRLARGRDHAGNPNTRRLNRHPRRRKKAKPAPPETNVEASDPAPEKTAERPAAKPEPKPKPKPEPAPEPNPKPPPTLGGDEEHSPYDATVTVSGVADGDTIEVTPAIDGVEDVRLIGVDTPETVDPSEEVEPYGPEAPAFATQELVGRKVQLEFGLERWDDYDRLLAYIYTGGRMFNEELVEGGYAQAYPYPPNTKYEARFEAAQDAARSAELGIWGLTLAQQCQLADRGNGIGEGTAGCSASASASSSTSASPSTSAKAKPSGGGAVAPISEDDCPQSAPIKGNQSGLYHVPGGTYYDVTNPEECFATASEAEAAGYEASSR
jgi:micrococcal nuclease